MKKLQIGFTLILFTFNGCNDTYKLRYDVEIKFADFDWTKRIEGVTGNYYVVQDELLLGDNYHATYYKISLDNGDILDTLENYKMIKEKEHLIIDKERTVFQEGYSEHQVRKIDGFKYQELILKDYDSQYRGDHETFFMTLKTKDNTERILKFNRDEFNFISDIIPFDNDKLIIVYNSQSAGTDHPYFDNVGILDLSKLIK